MKSALNSANKAAAVIGSSFILINDFYFEQEEWVGMDVKESIHGNVRSTHEEDII